MMATRGRGWIGRRLTVCATPPQAGVLDGVLCLCVDRLARAYAYQVLILEEFERFGVSVRFLEGPTLCDDPQATLLVQMQGVIAEYEKAKIAERYRRGKLYRARAGEIVFWKVSYGHRRVLGAGGEPARIEVFEPEARGRARDLRAYVERGLSVRQIAFWLRERGIPSPTGKPIWGTSTIDRLLRNEAYIGTMYYNRHESLEGDGPRGVAQPQDPPARASARGVDRDLGPGDHRSRPVRACQARQP